jgi:hypothetical protein
LLQPFGFGRKATPGKVSIIFTHFDADSGKSLSLLKAWALPGIFYFGLFQWGLV